MIAAGRSDSRRPPGDERALRVLRRLEWRLRRRISTQLTGGHRSIFHGRGMEFDQVVKYGFGDDIRDIDWNVTARLGEPYRKVFVEERDVPLVVIFADDPALRFGSATAAKRDVLLELAGLVLMLAVMNRGRVGLVHAAGTRTVVHPPTRQRERVMSWLLELFAAPPPDVDRPAPAQDMLIPVARFPRNALIVRLGEIPAAPPLPAWRALRRAHRAIGMRVEDAWEREPPEGLSGMLFDPTTGETFRAAGGEGVQAAHRAWRAGREKLWAEWWPDPADRLVVDSAADPLGALVAFLARSDSRGARSVAR